MKKCKQGYYYCYTDEVCKPIPKGLRVTARFSGGGKEPEETGIDVPTNGNGDGNGNGNGNGGDGGGGMGESTILEKLDGKSAKDKGYSLRDWFKGGGWKQAGGKYDGKPCAKQPGQTTKPYCRDADDRAAMSKDERDKRAAKKRKEDPNPDRKGKAKIVSQKNSFEPEGNLVDEGKKDACYKKVKASAKVWPSAYASGRLVQCRKKGAANYGNKSESVEFSNWRDEFKATEYEFIDIIKPEPLVSEASFEIGHTSADVRKAKTKKKIRDRTKTNDEGSDIAKKKLKGPSLPMEEVDTRRAPAELVARMSARREGEMAQDGPNKPAYDAKQRLLAKTKAKRMKEQVETVDEERPARRRKPNKPYSQVDLNTTKKDFYKQAGKAKDKQTIKPGTVHEKERTANPTNKYFTHGSRGSAYRNTLARIYSHVELEGEQIEEKKDPCWNTHKQEGMKKKGGKMVPNCVPKEEVKIDESHKNPESVKGIAKELDKAVEMHKSQAKRLRKSGVSEEKEESKIGGGNLKKLGAKAVRRVDADVDGDVDTHDMNSPETGSFVPSPDGKKLKPKVRFEDASDWRSELDEGWKSALAGAGVAAALMSQGGQKAPDKKTTTSPSRSNTERVSKTTQSKNLSPMDKWRKNHPGLAKKSDNPPEFKRNKLSPINKDWAKANPKLAEKEKDNRSKLGEGAAWTKKSGKNKKGGLNEKGRKSYEAENPGSDLKAPSKKKGNKRRESFCARMKGMKKKLTSAKTARDPDSRINKSLRAWNC